MRIGILTFQNTYNFGAQLQCFALQEVLKELGHQPEIIQLQLSRPTPFYRGVDLKRNGIRKAFTILLLRLLFASKMRKRFHQFKNKYLTLSSACTIQNIASVANTYDAIITGSDQIWGWSNHSHASFFIGWKPSFQGKRISYAPCCAKNKIDESHKSSIKDLLYKYDAISVRNEETFNFVKDLTDKEPPILADPTFLIDFMKHVGKPISPYKKYIVTYILGSEIKGGHQETLNKIKSELGNIPVISIVLTENKPMICSWADKTYWTADPMEWVNLFYHSSFAYTDSFHALVFALKFHKRFIAYYTEEARASRFIDMAKRYEITPGIITSLEDAKQKNSFKYIPHYEHIDDLIDKQVKDSMSYLQQALTLKQA